MIAVTGATGRLGGLIIEQLLQKLPASSVVALVRDLEKAAELVKRGVTVREANYDEPATLSTALAGVNELMFVSGSEVGKRVSQHQAVIAAAKQAGVGLVVYTSLLRADSARMSLAVEHVATEQALAHSGLPVVVLRNGWYTENYTDNLGSALQHGAILGAAKDGRVAAAPRADYAAAAVAVLTSTGHAGKRYELAGDTAFTLAELAAEVSKKFDTAVRYTDLPSAEYIKTLESFGVPAPFAQVLASADEGLARGELDVANGDLRRLIGRPTTPLAQSLAEVVLR